MAQGPESPEGSPRLSLKERDRSTPLLKRGLDKGALIASWSAVVSREGKETLLGGTSLVVTKDGYRTTAIERSSC